MKEIKIERITCKCGQVIAGCVNGAQDDLWDNNKQEYIRSGGMVDIVPVKEFSFGDCNCETGTLKKYFKFLSAKQIRDANATRSI